MLSSLTQDLICCLWNSFFFNDCFVSSFFLLGILDLVLNFPGFHKWKFTDVLRNVLKIIVSLAWAIILPLCYVHSFKVAPDKIKDLLSFFKEVKDIPALYLLAVAVYMLPNILAAALFIFPMLRRWIENSDWLIIRFLLWWSQVCSLAWFSHKLFVSPRYHYLSIIFMIFLCHPAIENLSLLLINWVNLYLCSQEFMLAGECMRVNLYS